MCAVNVRYFAFGELAVTVDGVRRPITRRRERSVLAVLLAVRGAPVTAERLVGEVWGDEAPGQTLAALQVAVSRLRSVLEPGRSVRGGTRLVSTAAGYALRADVAEVDTWQFVAIAEAALAEGGEPPQRRLELCDRARAAWVAAPYGDSDAPTVRAEVARLEELLLTVHERRARTLLDLGRPEQAQRGLSDLVAAHPFRERMWGLLALAQYQSSRQAEALETLRVLRERLVEELGVDPSEEIRRLESGILQQDPALAAAAPASVDPPADPGAPSPEVRSATEGAAQTVPIAEPAASVGRDGVLDRLVGVHRTTLDRGGLGFALVAGEPGIGKSQLVRELAAAATAQGSTVLVGHCLEGGYAPALWPWLGVVRPLAARYSAGPGLAPLLGQHQVAPPSGPGTTLRMYDAVVDLLSEAARQAPVLVLLEDLHWADASSLTLLRHLAGSTLAGPVTVVCTRRTTETHSDDQLVDTMAALSRAGAERIRLDGIDEQSVRTLLERGVGRHDPRLDAFVAEVSGGNPFFVLQYARLLDATPDLVDVDPAGLPVPDGVRDVMRQRLARLPREASRLLTSASVLGRLVDPEVLAELTDVTPEECLDQLDLALASGLLEEEASGYAFVHALTRESLHVELSAARRMRLHDRAGRIIESRAGSQLDAAAEIAHHAHVAAPLGEEQRLRACDWLARAAAVAVARQAQPEALVLWEQVLVNSAPGSLAAADAQRGRAAALMRLGRMEEAHLALDTSVALARELGEWEMVARATTALSGVGPWSWREHGVVHTPFVEVLTEAVPHVAPALQARLLAILQMEHFYGRESAVVEDYGVRSIELARSTGDTGLLREVLMLRLIASFGSWRSQDRLALVQELLGLEPQGELEVTALFYLGQVLWDCGDAAGADAAMRRCQESAAQVRHTGLEIPLGWWLVARARDLDAPDQVTQVDEALAAHRAAGYIASLELECLSDIRRAEPGAPVSEDTIARAGRGSAALRALVAHAVLESGDAERARALLGDPLPAGAVDYSSTAGRCLRLLVLCGTGSAEEIREVLEPVEDHLGAPVSYGTIDHLGVVDHFVAAAYAALGDPRAAEVARSAVERNRALTCLPWMRRSETLLAAVGG